MLRKHPLLGRTLSLLILGAYLAGLYFLYNTFLAGPNGAHLLDLGGPLGPGSGLLGRSNTTQKILHSADGGKSWQVVYSGQNRFLYSLICPGPQNCLATGYNYANSQHSAGDYDKLLALSTQDGGQSWSSATLPLQNDPYSDDEDYTTDDTAKISCPKPAACFLLGQTEEGSVLEASVDGGKTWVGAGGKFAPGETLSAMSCLSEKVCFATGNDGLLLATFDAGQSWQTQKAGTDASLLSLSCATSTGQFCMALGRSGIVVVTTDGGQSWSKKTATPGKSFSRIKCPVENTCYGYGFGGSSSSNISSSTSSKLAVTRDAGASWQTLPAPSQGSITGLACAGADFCLASGQSGKVRATQNGAQSWIEYPLNKPGDYLLSLSCPAQNNCYALLEPELD